jgi:integrase
MRGSRRKGRRPGTWELRIDAGLDPLTGRRRQRSVVFEGTAREADAKLAELTVEAGRGRLQSGAHALSELLERGLEQAASEGLERSTLRGYRRVAENQIAPALGARRITKITAEDLDAFYRALAKKGYSASTIKQSHAVLRRVFDTAVRWRWIGHNPARDARPPRVAKPDPVPVPPEVIPVLVEGAARHNPELAACIVLAADTGARRGELCALRWSKVDLLGSKLRIDRAIGEDGAGAYEKDTKNHQHRTITLSPPTLAVLVDHRRCMEQRAAACGTELAADGFVFSASPDGTVHWWPSNLDTSFRRLCRRLGLPDSVKLHGLRHTQVTQLLDAGVPLRTVSGRVGHLNSSTTSNIYSHWIAETDERAAVVIGERIWGQPKQMEP